MLNKELTVQPQWKHRKIRIYLQNPQDKLYTQHHMKFPQMRGKFRKDMMNIMIGPINQHGTGKRVAEIIEGFTWDSIVEKRFLIKGTEDIFIPYRMDGFVPRDDYLHLEFVDIKESFLSYLIQSGIKVNERINSCNFEVRDISEEFIKELQEMFSLLAMSSEKIDFDKYINNWAERLLIMPPLDFKQKVIRC